MNRKARMGTGAAATVAALIGTGIITSAPASAHGYVEGPLSRTAACNVGLNTGCGSLVYEPQSLEGAKGFPAAGPADGQIASAGGLFGGLLDQQGTERWYKNDITTGPLLMDWKYTAPHATSKWHYYMTKPGWDPNAPLERSDLELIAEVQHDGSKANTNPDHVINVPGDRSGYHVILAVWDVADTVNAFYNVIDVNVVGEGSPDQQPPTIPVGLEAQEVGSNSVVLDWRDSSDDSGVVSYAVYRDGVRVATTSASEFTDQGLAPGSAYEYAIVAIDPSGNSSDASGSVDVRTESAPAIDVEAPSVPTYLHSMGETSDAIELMWNASSDNSGSVQYLVFRDGQQIARTGMTMFTDSGLAEDRNFTYTVQAIDAAGNVSPASNALTVATLAATKPDPAPVPTAGGTWDPFANYSAGDRVTYGSATYQAVQSHTGIGDPNWISAPSLWVVVTDASAPAPEPEPAPATSNWNPTGSYSAGDLVTFNGSTFEAVQAHTGNGDPNWISAPSLWRQL